MAKLYFQHHYTSNDFPSEIILISGAQETFLIFINIENCCSDSYFVETVILFFPPEFLKGLVHPKMKSSVINFSLTCHFKPERLSFIFRTLMKISFLSLHGRKQMEMDKISMFRSNLFCKHCSFVGQRRTDPRLSLGSPKVFFSIQ